MFGRVTLYQRLSAAALLIVFGWLAILIEITPINQSVTAPSSPDILFCILAFMAIRRPDTTSVWLVLLLALSRDLLTGGPVGLGALTILAAVESLRIISALLRRRRVIEIAAIITAAFAINIIQAVLLTVTLADTPSLMPLLERTVFTIATYPIVFFLFRQVLRVRGDTESLAGRVGTD
ncbi:MAG: rod shape-determining protein MreD [Pikeienuella sp.]